MNMIPLASLFGLPLLIGMVAWGVGAMLTARLTRPDLFFSITVHPSLRESSVGREILGKFTRAVAVFSLVGLALALAGVFARVSPAPGLALLLSGLVVESAGIVNAYITARRRVRQYQVEPSTRREAVVGPRQVQVVGGWLGQAGPFLILGFAAVFLGLNWHDIPARFPIHWGADGQPNGWAARSPGGVFLTPMIGGISCLFLSVLFNGFARGVRRIHSSEPEGEGESLHLRRILSMIPAI